MSAPIEAVAGSSPLEQYDAQRAEFDISTALDRAREIPVTGSVSASDEGAETPTTRALAFTPVRFEMDSNAALVEEQGEKMKELEKKVEDRDKKMEELKAKAMQTPRSMKKQT